MNFAKKAIAAATSAALLASLVAAAVAPSAFAAGSVVSSGSTTVGNTSTNPFVLTLTDAGGASYPGGTITVTLTDSAGNIGNVTFSGTPTVTGSVSEGITSSTLTNAYTLSIVATAGSTLSPNTIVVSSKIALAATTPTGAITATVKDPTGTLLATTTTANGTLSQLYLISATSVVVNDSGCAFGAGAGYSGFTIGGTAYAVTSVGTLSNGLQLINLTGSLTANYALGTAVSETIPPCAIAAFTVGTAVNGIAYAAESQPNMSAGVNNQLAGDLTIAESNFGTLALNSTLNFTILTPGVTLSGIAPSAEWVNGPVDATAGTGTVSTPATVDSTTWKTFSVTVTKASTGASATTGDVIEIYGIQYDLAPTVPAGTQIMVGLTNSGGVPQDNASVSNAIVGYQIAASAATPTVYIGFNAQNTGMITMKELGAGYFTASTGNNNEIWICNPEHPNQMITTAPWLVVANPVAGNLTLVSPTTGLPVSQALATSIGNDCWGWSVYAASTVPTTLEILGTNATNTAPLAAAPGNGLQINVPSTSQPGPVYLDLFTGQSWVSSAPIFATHQDLTIAYRAFKNQLTIAASSAPWMALGSLNNVAGNLVLTETQIGQLHTGDAICVDVANSEAVSFGGLNTSNQPLAVANTNASGLIVGPVSFDNYYDCQGHSTRQVQLGVVLGGPHFQPEPAASFHFEVAQGSVTTLGSVTISNILYNVDPAATAGPVALDVYVSAGALQDSQGFVVNANVGTQPTVKISAATAVGATKNATFTTKTKVVPLSGYVTWKFTLPAALVGKTVTIWVSAKQADGTWGASKALTTRLIDLNGNAYFWWKSASATWVAVKASYGDTTYGMSVSASPQARWMVMK